MQITGGSSAEYHPNTGIKTSHSSSVNRMRWNKVQMMLLSPKAFQVSASGNSGVGFDVHAGKVGNDETTGKTKKSEDSLRWRVQFRMLIVRPQDPFLIRERSSHPPDPNPPITQHIHLIGPLCSLTLLISFLISQGPPSYFGSVFSHGPHQLPLYPVCRCCSSFIILVRRPTSFPIFIQPLSVQPTHTPFTYSSFPQCCLPFVLPFS